MYIYALILNYKESVDGKDGEKQIWYVCFPLVTNIGIHWNVKYFKVSQAMREELKYPIVQGSQQT